MPAICADFVKKLSSRRRLSALTAVHVACSIFRMAHTYEEAMTTDEDAARVKAEEDAAKEKAYADAFDAVIAKVRVGELATSLGENIATVSNWRKRGIPPMRCKAVETLTGISVRVMRPLDWEHYWPPEPEPVKATANS